ncbi:MAG: hypothetical protein RLZZ450_2961 [Pseudomonadota bacterium]|jgi:hypothetical protein
MTFQKINIEDYRRFIELEVSLAEHALRSGLSSLRGYNFADKGSFFSAMFMLSIGLERIKRLSFVFHSFQSLDRLPTDDELKKQLGHMPTTSFEVAREIARRRCSDVSQDCFDDPHVRRALELLDQDGALPRSAT